MTVWISYSKSTDNSESDGIYPISMRQDLSKAQNYFIIFQKVTNSNKIEIPLRFSTVSVCQNLKKTVVFIEIRFKFSKKEKMVRNLIYCIDLITTTIYIWLSVIQFNCMNRYITYISILSKAESPVDSPA